MGIYKDTKIILGNGKLIPIKNLKVGDYVMGYDSKTYKVKNIEVTKQKIYKINSELIKDLYIDNYQKLIIRHNNDLKKVELSSSEMREPLLFSKNIVDFKFSIDDITIDPYLLGFWFSLETKEEFINLNFLNTDNFHIINDCYLKSIRKMVKYYDETGDYDSLKINKNTIFLDYINKIIKNKFIIPNQYKFSNIENRKKFIAGILDNLGEIINTEFGKTIRIKLTNEKLAKDIEFILHSLGFFTNNIKIKFNSNNLSIHLYIFGYFRDIPLLMKKNLLNYKFNYAEKISITEFKKKDDSYNLNIENCDYIFGEDFTIYSV